MPYTKSQRRSFPIFINELSADPAIKFVIHLGDILGGNTPCDTIYMEWVRDIFNTYAKALMYTPGDNEWTDCRNGKNPLYPLERLTALRHIFFPLPGKTLGQNPRLVMTQCREIERRTPCLPENQMWTEPGMVFGLLHIPGSDNGLEPWSKDAVAIAKQSENFNERLAATLSWLVLEYIFAHAHKNQANVVILGMQADMWTKKQSAGSYSTIVQTLAHLACEFKNPVFLLEGDAHSFTVDRPLAHGDALHGVAFPVRNITRIVVQGGRWHPLEYLRVNIDPQNREAPLSAVRVTLGGGTRRVPLPRSS